MNNLNIYRGIVIVQPHGDYLKSGKKKIIMKSKKYSDCVNKPLLVIQNKKAIGIIIIDYVQTTNLKGFNKKRKFHLITEKERKKWWKNKTKYHEYKIKYKHFFHNPIPIDYLTGPQTFVRPEHIIIKQHIYIGTSGYDYNWFNLSSTKSLIYYSSQFNSLELNSSFYKIPNEKQCLKLYNNTPKNFRFSIKVHQSITHYGKLNNKSINSFINKLNPLKTKIKCLLFQFSSKFKCSDKNLKKLKKIKTYKLKFAFEFRDSSWFNDEVYKLFKHKKNWTIVFSYYKGFNFELDNKFVFNFLYIRMHGTVGKYQGSHAKIIPKLVDFIRQLYDSGITNVFAYFNNTDSFNKKGISHALYDAYYMKKYVVF